MEWITVVDAIPGKAFFFEIVDVKTDTGQIHQAWFHPDAMRHICCYFSDRFSRMPLRNVTHWRKHIPGAKEVIDMANKVIRKIEDDLIRDVDGSKMNEEHANRMINAIRECECHLKSLLELTEEVGGFGSSYPKQCLESLKIFRTILSWNLMKEYTQHN